MIPHYYAGEEYWDAQGLWVGTALSNYGILYNKDSLARLGFKEPPRQWADLQDPRLLGEVALAELFGVPGTPIPPSMRPRQ